MKRISEMLIAIAAVCLLLLPIGVQALGEKAAEEEQAAEVGMIEALAAEETPEEEPLPEEAEAPAEEAPAAEAESVEAAEEAEAAPAAEPEIPAETDVPAEETTEAPAAEEPAEEVVTEEAVAEAAPEFVPALDGAALAAPKLVSAKCVDMASGSDAGSARGVQVEWEAVSGAAKYLVFYKTGSGSWTKVGDTTGTSMTIHLSNFTYGTTYVFTVRGVDSAGNKGAYDANGLSVKFLLATPMLLEVTEASGTDASGGEVKLSWETVVGAEQYRVFRKTGSGGWVTLGETDGTSFTDEAPPAGKLFYTVRCISSDHKVYMSAYDTAGLSITRKLAAPKLKSAANAANGVIVKWNAVTGAEKYRVFRKVGTGGWKKLADVTGTSYTDTTAASGTTYAYTVRCVSADGKSYTSSYDATGKTVTYIAAPKLKSAAAAANGVTVKWNAVTGAEKYRVFRKVGSGGWKKLADVTGTSYTDTSAASGTTYAYTVRCVSADGKSYTSAYDATGKSITFVAAPVLKSAANAASGVTVKWNAVTGAEKYRVFRKTGSGGWKKVADVTGTSYTDTTAKSGTTYAYTVRCVSADGKSYTSGYDTTGKTVAYIAAPVLKSVSAASSGVTVTWNAVTGAEQYRVFRKTGSGSWKKLANVTGTSYTDTTVVSGTEYAYTVRCISADGKSYTSAYDTAGKSISYVNDIVYVSNNGIIHSRSNCSGMKNYTSMTYGAAVSKGYTECKNCF